MHDCSFQRGPKSSPMVFNRPVWSSGSSAEVQTVRISTRPAPKGTGFCMRRTTMRAFNRARGSYRNATNPSTCGFILPEESLTYPGQSAWTRLLYWRTSPSITFFIRVGPKDGPSLRLYQVRDATRGGQPTSSSVAIHFTRVL